MTLATEPVPQASVSPSTPRSYVLILIVSSAIIERICKTESELRNKIKEVVLHEIGHYLGMSEAEVRRALKDF